MPELGKVLLGFGLAIAVIGILLLVAGSVGLPLGRLPGDFSYRGKHFSFFFPLGTCILISAVVSLLFWLISRIHR